ncbi:unnamed protein product [Onchocerca ochengi]|uniref:Mediator of RNA polymerase II transcription subunit 29 n=1 Tax=Onchocerca ochengi TaxID=42157 RepID=A0A182E2G2_ONCOC|nr:unnamed protein product [Onchocerca ochengi]
MNALLRDAVNTVEEAHKSIDRQNEVNKAIETELSCFNNDVNREFNECVGRSFIEASTSYLSEIHFDNIEETFTEVLQLVYNSVQNLRRLPCTLDGTMVGENMDQNNLLDEANKLLKMCANIQQKIMNVESTSKIGSSASSGTEAVLSEDDRIISTSDLNSNEEQ